MCTVTYIPATEESGFILTSNRDERVLRETRAPQIFEKSKMKLCYPMDAESGGSWIATSEDGRLCCLLNGGLEVHEKQVFHTYSRGKVLLDFISTREEVPDFFNDMDLSNVEPFTIITIEQDKGSVGYISESVWDGSRKLYKQLDKQQPYIWSSVTLYDADQRLLRRSWFQKFIQEFYPLITSEQVLKFHSETHSNDRTINFLMEREGGLKTVSITQVIPRKGQQCMKYFNLIEDTKHEIEI